MARGQQKIQAQQKNAEKQAKIRKQGSTADRKKAAGKALTSICSLCKAAMPDCKTYKMHWDSKHSKYPYPEELKEVVV